jgi:hypothetical protein
MPALDLGLCWLNRKNRRTKSNRSFTYEEFNACQQRHQKKAAEGLAVRNEEVLRSIEDIIDLVRCVGSVRGSGASCVGSAVSRGCPG